MAFTSFPPLKLNDFLASNASADEEDVLNVKQRLNASGHYEVPSYGMTQYPDNRLFDGIKSFQRDQGLTVDGYMRPGGETEDALNKAMADRTPPDPLTERQEAVIAFAKKYGMAEDQAREYMTKPSIFKTSGQRSVTAAPQLVQNASQPITQTTPQSSPSTSQPITTAPKPVTLTPQQQADADYRIKVRDGVARYKQYDTARRPPFQPILPVLDDKAVPHPPLGWDNYMKALQDDLTTPKVSQSLATTNFLEGGMAKNPNPNSTAAGGGFIQGTLDRMKAFMKETDHDPVKMVARDRLKEAGIDKVLEPKNLTEKQSIALAKSALDLDLSRIGGHEAVEMIDNGQAAAALLDTLHRHGGPGGIRAIQHAINQVRPRSVTEDGIMGSETFQLYQKLGDDPDAWRLLGNALADERMRTLWQGDFDQKFKAEKDRRIKAKTYRPEDDPEVRRGITAKVEEGDYKRLYYFTVMGRPKKK